MAIPTAILPDGTRLPPTGRTTVYTAIRPTEIPDGDAARIYKRGLPARGRNWDLWEHAEPTIGKGRSSAFRGATALLSDPELGQGAAYWADEGGYVVEVNGAPWWDVNMLLEYKIPTLGGLRSPLMHGENELALAGRIPPENIKRIGRVIRLPSNRLTVQWISR